MFIIEWWGLNITLNLRQIWLEGNKKHEFSVHYVVAWILWVKRNNINFEDIEVN